MIRDAGHDPVVIDYVVAGWTRAQLLGLFAAADVFLTLVKRHLALFQTVFTLLNMLVPP